MPCTFNPLQILTNTKHPETPSSLWGSVSRPYPTGAWWTNLVMNDGEGAVAPLPYGVRVRRTGVELSYHGACKASPDNVSVTMTVDAELVVGAKESIVHRAVTKYDDLSVTLGLYTSNVSASRLAEPDGGVTVTLARGAPFITLRYDGATPALRSTTEIISFVALRDAGGNSHGGGIGDDGGGAEFESCAAHQACILATLHGPCCPLPSDVFHPCCSSPPTRQTGTVFGLHLGSGAEWRVYTSHVVEFVWSSHAVVASAPLRGVLRVAALPVPKASPGDALGVSVTRDAVAAVLDAHAGVYATGGVVETDVSLVRDEALLRYRWSTAALGDEPGAAPSWRSSSGASASLLALLLPHHRDALLVEPAAGATGVAVALDDTPLRFVAIKGPMTPVVGATWVLREPLTTIGFFPPRSVTNATMARAIRAQLVKDSSAKMKVSASTGMLYLDPNGEDSPASSQWYGARCHNNAVMTSR